MTPAIARARDAGIAFEVHEFAAGSSRGFGAEAAEGLGLSSRPGVAVEAILCRGAGSAAPSGCRRAGSKAAWDEIAGEAPRFEEGPSPSPG
jgi:hypothetical protein